MIGRIISDYCITEYLGRGAMGEVYKARHTRLNTLIVSIKFIPEHLLGDTKAKERFVRQAEALAATNHEPPDRVIANLHNQTLNVAVKWGLVGVVLLYAMWLVHLLLFRGEGLVAWIGLLVVVQNMFTSLFNSHLFDFHEGWMYVLGVGIAGGMVLRARSEAAESSGTVRA